MELQGLEVQPLIATGVPGLERDLVGRGLQLSVVCQTMIGKQKKFGLIQ